MIHEFNLPLLTFNDDGVRNWFTVLNTAMLFCGLTRSTLTGQLDIDNVVYPVLVGSDLGFRFLLPVIYEYNDGLGDVIRISFEVGKYRQTSVTSTNAYDTYSCVRTTVGSVNPVDNSTRTNPFISLGWHGNANSVGSSTGSKLAGDTVERYTKHSSLEKSVIIKRPGFLAMFLQPYYKQIRSDMLSDNASHTQVSFAVERSHDNTDYTNSYLNVLSYIHVPTITGNPNNSVSYLVTVVGNTTYSSQQNILYPSDIISPNGFTVYNILKRNSTGAIESYFKNLFVCSPLVSGHGNKIIMNLSGLSVDVYSVANTSYTNTSGSVLAAYNLLVRY